MVIGNFSQFLSAFIPPSRCPATYLSLNWLSVLSTFSPQLTISSQCWLQITQHRPHTDRISIWSSSRSQRSKAFLASKFLTAEWNQAFFLQPPCEIPQDKIEPKTMYWTFFRIYGPRNHFHKVWDITNLWSTDHQLEQLGWVINSWLSMMTRSKIDGSLKLLPWTNGKYSTPVEGWFDAWNKSTILNEVLKRIITVHC